MVRPFNRLRAMQDNDNTHFGFQSVSIAEKAGRVAKVFSSVASRYDLMNDLMSLGTHRLMKRFAVEMTRARAGQTIVDLAGGTGDLTRGLADRVGNDGTVLLCDINASMLGTGRDRLIDAGYLNNIQYVQADAEQLPFAENSLDAITMAFGIRNVTRKERAFESMCRVLKPGGRAVILEFSKPRDPVLGNAYRAFSRFWPNIGEWVADDRESYQYLVESIEMHPDQDTLAAMMTDQGFVDVQYHNMMNGIVAIHEGRA